MNESIRQEIKTAQDSQVTGNMVDSTALNVREMQAGSFLISGDNNQVTIYGSVIKTQEKRITPAQLKTNPYQGLLAFQERDYQRFFGRDRQIKTLWTKLRDLYEQNQQLRFLPVYGPSGCGKSSLVRAGLIPELVRHPLPVCHSVRVATLVPGPRPLEALAMVLAKVATNEPTPVAKSEEFLAVLEKPCAVKPGMLGNQPEFCGLRKIAALLPEIDTSPLIVFVDQFEEIYSLCQSEEEREAFIGNLVQAAGDRSQQVTVVVTFRSDFLRELQQHPPLYHLFSEQGVLVRPLLVEELREAIAKPAELADHPLDEAVITLLLQQMQGQDHALPLLQFALTRIWEGLEAGVSEVETLTTIGGVGGALAGEAQRLYERLDEGDRALARRMFLGLVQLGEGSEDTRRRVLVSELVACSSEDEHLEIIIEQFAAPGVRFVSVSLNQQHQETLEVTHEALIRHWNQLQDWIKESREALRKKRKIEELAQDWQESGQSKGYLLQGRPLRDAKEFQESSEGETALSALAREFIRRSQWKRRGDRAKSLAVFFIIPSILSLIPLHFLILARAKIVIHNGEMDFGSRFFIQYLWIAGETSNLHAVDMSNENLQGINIPSRTLDFIGFRTVEVYGESRLVNTDFSNAKLTGIFIEDTNMKEANLTGTNLRGSHLNRVNLQEGKLIGSDFRGAILQDIDLRNSQIVNTNFKNATLKNLDFSNIHQPILLSNEQFESAEIICDVKFPEHIDIDPNRDC